jgi:predicted permease
MNASIFIEEVLRDARYGLRTFRAKPGFGVATLLSLALGIGANIAIFTVVNSVLIRPLSFPDPGALVGVYSTAVFQGEAVPDLSLSPAMYVALGKGVQSFQQFGVWTSGTATVTGTQDPEEIASVTVTHGVLPALGVRPQLGRWFSVEDDTTGNQETVILSHGYWLRKFGGDSDILGRTILVDFVPREIVGIMPATFRFINQAPDLYLPQRFPSSQLRADIFNHRGVARLKSGMTLSGANQEVALVLNNLDNSDPVGRMVEQLQIKPNLRPLKQDVVGDVGDILGVLMGALVLVLLLVCANVTNLVLVRTQSRRQEFATRAALGAGRGRIVRELLVESLVLGLMGGALGLVLAYGGLKLLVAFGPPDIPRLGEVSIDSMAVSFALACSIGSSILFGLLAITKCGLGGRIERTRGATHNADHHRTQNALVVTQVALAVVLLVASGLMVRTFFALRSVPPGFTQSEQVQTVRISIPEAQVREPERVIRMQSDILERLAGIPGVSAAAFTSSMPMELEFQTSIVVAAEGVTPLDQVPPVRELKYASPGLFVTQGTRLVLGRDFTWNDVFRLQDVAIVSENLARETWGALRNALGKRIRVGAMGPWTQVVGVVENVYEDGVDQPAPRTVYLRGGVEVSMRPERPDGVRRNVTFALRSGRVGSAGFLQEVTTAIHEINANLALAEVRTLSDVYRLSMARKLFGLILVGLAGVMALTLALVGVYGVLAYVVAERRREVCIRLALGAKPSTVWFSLFRQGMILTCIGGSIGLAGASGLSRWVSSLLFGITPLDPITYVLSAVVIFAATAAASCFPARQASRLDPAETLRAD